MASFSERYHELSKLLQPGFSLYGPRWERRLPEQKFYGEAPRFKLELGEEGELEFGGKGFLAHLLQGVAGVEAGNFGGFKPRPHPSPGMIFSTNVFLALRGAALPDGVYFFEADSCELVQVGGLDYLLSLGASFPEFSAFRQASVSVLLTVSLDRAVPRFGEAAYRLCVLEAGGALSNILQAASAAGVYAVPLGGFVDAEWEHVLELPSGEFPVAAVALGPEFKATRPEVLPSLDPYEAFKTLALDSSLAQLLCQNAAERIPEVYSRPQIPALPEEHALNARPLLPDHSLTEIFKAAPAEFFRPHTKHLFAPVSLSLVEFSAVLTAALEGNSPHFSVGFLACYVAVLNVEGFVPGLYRYSFSENSLSMFCSENPRSGLETSHSAQRLAERANFAVLFAANLDAATRLLGDRAYRYLLLDAGILGSALAMFASGLGLEAHGEFGFYENILKRKIGLDTKESILHETLVGKPIS